jgi:hypothetical protein
MDGHDIQLVEHFAAIGTLSHPIGNAVIDARPTEDVATCLECGVLEVVVTDGTSGEFLQSSKHK